MTVDALLFGVLWLAWLVSRQYNRVLQRLSQRERIRITWGLRGEPRITVVKTAAAAEGGERPASRPHSRQHSRSLSLAGTHGRAPSRSLSLPSAAGEAAGSAAAAALDGASGATTAADGIGRAKPSGLLGFAQRRRAPGGPASKVKAGQVWAAWGGPGAEADGGYEPLLEDAPSPRSPHAHPAACQLGSSGGTTDAVHTRDSFELAAPRRPLSAGGMHARHVSITNEDEMTPRQLHSLLVARHRQSLGSPLSSMHAGLGERACKGARAVRMHLGGL